MARLVEYVVLSEFDIDKGSTCRHQYPTDVPGYEPSFFAENMLPEGAHNHKEDWTVFFLNRDSDDAELSGVTVYFFNKTVNDWRLAWHETDGESTLAFQQYTIRVRSHVHSGRSFEIPIHGGLQYTSLTPTFVSVYCPDGRAVGLLFKSEADLGRFKAFIPPTLLPAAEAA